MFDPTLSQVVRYTADAVVRLAHTASSAEDMQWEASPRAGKRTGGTDYSDPVYDTVTDERRLAVRAAMENARARLMEAAEAAREANRELTAAMENWRE